MNVADLRRQADMLAPWFHNLHLPGGVQTCPEHPFGDFPAFKWALLAPHLPDDLTGWRALDIGCNAGFYSIELAGRGARVVAVDHDPHYLEQARWACAILGLDAKIELRCMQAYELAACPGQFDLVLFMGVFYHLRYPLLGLDIAARLARRLFVFQSMMLPVEYVLPRYDHLGLNDRHVLLNPGWPQMAFIEGSFHGDPTNWWVPNRAAVEAMLRSTGLRIISRVEEEIFLCEPETPRHAPLYTVPARVEFDTSARREDLPDPYAAP